MCIDLSLQATNVIRREAREAAAPIPIKASSRSCRRPKCSTSCSASRNAWPSSSAPPRRTSTLSSSFSRSLFWPICRMRWSRTRHAASPSLTAAIGSWVMARQTVCRSQCVRFLAGLPVQSRRQVMRTNHAIWRVETYRGRSTTLCQIGIFSFRCAFRALFRHLIINPCFWDHLEVKLWRWLLKSLENWLQICFELSSSRKSQNWKRKCRKTSLDTNFREMHLICINLRKRLSKITEVP